MNGGKDVKIGHDKRPISVIPKDQQPLYNISNGELLTDQDGNPLITEVDQFFLPDASKERATSVTFPTTPQESYSRRQWYTNFCWINCKISSRCWKFCKYSKLSKSS